ncbi:MAG: alkaline phosphatase family protein [Clostridia bacterium]|nr:alkaline phosphatase family protein [Clostridia bacterium]
MLNENSLDTICAALAHAMGIEPPENAAPANPELVEYIDRKLGDQKADRIFMYNPDAIAQWIYEKYKDLLLEATEHSDIEIPLRTVMPSVTPVCFATMYTGAQPEVHGIRKYEKPVVMIDTLFDALIRAGKKAAIVSQLDCSMSAIFREREMDYFIYPTVSESNAKSAELILSDQYDFIAVYNKNYDAVMHKTGPEGVNALAELRVNAESFAFFSHLIRKHWAEHNTLVGFAMDHGCHEIDGQLGSHGLDMEEDLNIVHLYRIYAGKANTSV